ncbi:MAG: hypothetical protein AAF433_00860 [Bacteroidota bacterium]
MTLTQVNWPRKIVFEISGDFLLVKSSRWGNYNESKLRLDNISSERLEMRTAKSAYLVSSAIFAIITLVVFISRLSGVEVDSYAELIWLSISLTCLLLFNLSIRPFAKIILLDGGALYIDLNKPNRGKATQFIGELMRRGRYERSAHNQHADLN